MLAHNNTCKHGCRYCYATFNAARVKAAVEAHNDHSPLLTGTVTENQVIKPYAKAVSLKRRQILPEQISLF